MASGSKDDEDTVSKHVLEYYHRFSKNKHLPRYFSGTSVSYLPEIRGESDSEHELRGNPRIVITSAEKADTSRASSVLSNKKLEWDNGADIGYENCEATGLKRSSSLPALLDISKTPHVSFDSERSCSSGSELKIVILDTSSENNAAVVKPERSTSSSLCKEEKKLLSSSSSSSSFHQDKKVQHSSSSSSSKKDEKPAPGSPSHTSSSAGNILDFMSTLSYLKQKIGIPDAHSTPHENTEQKKILGHYSETPVLSTAQKPVRRLTEEVDKPKNDRPEKTKTVVKPNQKVVTLCFTEPISVECIGEEKPKIETIVAVKRSNISIQTDEISEKELIKIIAKSQASMNQSVLYHKHADNKNESSSQTGSDLLGFNCDSFEYICGRNINPRSKSSRERDVESEKVYVEVKKSGGQHHLETLNLSSDSQGSENCIVNEEIERSIHLIQKLIKSKKYDPTTKKRYIKKLIKKISESKFMEESSTSSDLFFPKRSEISKKLQHNTPSTETSSEPPQKTAHPNDFSWIPANKPLKLSPRKKPSETNISYQASSKSPPRKKDSQEEGLKLTSKKKPSKAKICYQDIHATENLSSPTEIIPVDSRDLHKNLFTLTNNEFSVNRDTELSKSKSSDNASMEKQYESASSQKSYHDWKDDKTNSERAFEKVRFVGDGDYLTNWASKERAFQINWINNEICHLGKLKNLLESFPSQHGESEASSESRSTGSQRITSVYQVSQGSLTQGENKPKKYVIQTQFDPKDGEPRAYMLNGEKYFVSEDNVASRPRQVLGDIEVLSSDTTMNIKVTTFCESCKRSPCVCEVRSKAKPHTAQTSIKNQRNVHSSEVCITCHTTPCVCQKSTGAIQRKCAECNLYPCGCVVRKDSYFGQFIPAKPPGPSITPPKQCYPKKASAECGETTEQYNSLKRVFENCSCTSTKCTCNFVEKLLKHFDVGQNRSVQDLNTPMCTCQDKNVQAESNVKSGGLQTLITGKDKDLQTDKKVHFASIASQHDVECQPSEINTRQFDSKINQTNRRELGDKDEETITDSVTLVEHAKIIGTKTQTDSSAFSLKDEAVNTLPTKVKHKLNRESFKAEGQNDSRKVGDEEALVYTPDSVNHEVIMVEPPSPDNLHKGIQSDAKQTLERVVINVRDSGVNNNNQVRGVKAKVAYQFPESEKLCTNQANNVAQRFSVRGSQTCQAEQEFQTQTEEIPMVHEEQATCDCQHAQTQTKTMVDFAAKGTQATCQGQRVGQAVQIPQVYEQGVQAQVLRSTQAARPGQEQGTQAGIFQEFSTKGIQAAHIDQRVTQAVQVQDFSAKSTQATCRDKRVTQSVQAPQVQQEYQKAKQTQTSEDRQASLKEAKAQKSVDTQTQAKGDLVKEIKVATYTDVQIRANTYPRSSTVGKKIKFVGSDSEIDKLRSNLKNVACMCRNGKAQETSSEGSEQALRRVKMMKNKRTETDRERGRVTVVEDRISEPVLTGRRRTTLKNGNVETDKQRTVGTCRCGFTDRVYLKDEGVQIGRKDIHEEVSYRNFSASSNGTAESTTITSTPPSYTTPTSLLTCICCDRRTTSDNVSVFTNNSREYFLCCNCVKKRPILTSICYTGPEKQSLLDSTAGQSSTLTRTESVGEFCSCIKPYRPKNSDYCSHCRNRLRKTTKSRGGIAYTLTLECDPSEKFKVKKRRKKPLEEIRVKVPCPYNRKKYKDRENLQRKSSFDTKTGLSSDKNDSADTNKTGNTHSNTNTESRSTCGTYKIDSSTGDSKEDKPKRPSTLQEYLKLNRPDFINSAEYRRNVVNNSKVDRIKNKDEIKLRFFEENINTTDPNIKTRLFSEREMKEITKRNYKKLPEVKQMAVHYKELKLKTADRFIKDMMAKKIQGSVLKGRRNFPIDRHVINLKK